MGSSNFEEQRWRWKLFLTSLALIFGSLLLVSAGLSNFQLTLQGWLTLAGVVFMASLAVAGVIATRFPYTPQQVISDSQSPDAAISQPDQPTQVISKPQLAEQATSQPDLKWGLDLDGTTSEDILHLEGGRPTQIRLHAPKQGEKRVSFHFYIHNDGNAPSTHIEARILFYPSRVWDLIREREYAREALELGDRWDVMVRNKVVVFWTFRGGGYQLLPWRYIPLGPFIALIRPGDQQRFFIECDVQSAELGPISYKPEVIIES